MQETLTANWSAEIVFFKLVREFFWTGERVFIGKLVRVFFELVREWWETKAASAGSKWQQPLSRLWGYEYSFTRTYHRLRLTNNFGKKREERNITFDGELQALIWGQDNSLWSAVEMLSQSVGSTPLVILTLTDRDEVRAEQGWLKVNDCARKGFTVRGGHHCSSW